MLKVDNIVEPQLQGGCSRTLEKEISQRPWVMKAYTESGQYHRTSIKERLSRALGRLFESSRERDLPKTMSHESLGSKWTISYHLWRFMIGPHLILCPTLLGIYIYNIKSKDLCS